MRDPDALVCFRRRYAKLLGEVALKAAAAHVQAFRNARDRERCIEVLLHGQQGAPYEQVLRL